MEHIEIIKQDENFENNLEIIITEKGITNDRSRPYDGQPWTQNGIRGRQEIKGITMRDLKDCIIQAMLVSSSDSSLSKKVFEISKDFQNTEYSAKGNWEAGDIYKIDFSKVDPMAIIQNVGCFVEYYMGIFPNTNKNKNLFG